MTTPYEEVPHTADWSLRVRGATLADLFSNAAEGMYGLLGAAGDAEPAPRTERQVALEAPDAESLLVAWLNELLYFTESEGLVFHRFEIEALDATRLRARAAGRPASNLNKQIKAVTFHNLEILRSPNGLEATLVFDV